MNVQFWIEHCGSSRVSTAEIKAGVAAATELCETLGVDMTSAYGQYLAEIECGPAVALWRRIEDWAIRAAIAGWHDTPDDLSLVPA